MSSVKDFLTDDGDWQCTSCGACCSYIKPVIDAKKLPPDFMMIDGSCKYLDKKTKLCSIYKTRPDICRINKSLKPHYGDLTIAKMCKVMKDRLDEIEGKIL